MNDVLRLIWLVDFRSLLKDILRLADLRLIELLCNVCFSWLTYYKLFDDLFLFEHSLFFLFLKTWCQLKNLWLTYFFHIFTLLFLNEPIHRLFDLYLLIYLLLRGSLHQICLFFFLAILLNLNPIEVLINAVFVRLLLHLLPLSELIKENLILHR